MSQQSPRSLPLSVIGVSLEELLQTGVIPDSSAEIENQFRGIAATNVPPISQTQPIVTGGATLQSVGNAPRQQRSPQRFVAA